ncbi:methyltransferase [Candidatus Soleaferrea massiliensis]|uniref:tRNA1(Val) (adenine(37)-N6)-methyltransferase n=1 Tax=Candidatus Soleaferrea massiliensis TaxID=1470354 RepID=UPI00058C4C1E
MRLQLEPLNERFSIYVSKEHTFGTDAFLLSDFAAPRRKDTVCDLGTGCGIIPLLWFRSQDAAPRHITAVDIQAKAIEQLKRTVRRNGLESRVTPLLADLKALGGVLPAASFDLITCNPPYKAPDAGIQSLSPSERIARHEVLCTLEDICRTASRLLRFGGSFCLCQRPERLVDVVDAMRGSGIEPKRLRFVQKNARSRPWLFLVQGKKGAKSFLRVEPPFLMDSPEAERLYRVKDTDM